MKVRILNVDFEVILQPNGNRDCGTDNSARMSHWHQKIWLDLQDRELDGIYNDLWHEIMEAINKSMLLKMEHQTITLIAGAIHQVLRQKEFFKEFEANLKKLKE